MLRTKMLLGLLVLLPACGRSAPSRFEPDLAAAERTVEAFFQAVEAKDCATATALLNGAALARFRKGGGCPNLFASDRVGNAKLENIGKIRPDGRDPKVVLVNVTLVNGPKQAQGIIRLRWNGQRFQILEM